MTHFTPADEAQLQAKGISKADVEAQIERFRTGFPYLRIESAVAPGRGMIPLEKRLEQEAVETWKSYLAQGGDVLKFVPASGAASRMFKALFEFVNGEAAVPAEGSAVAQLLGRIGDFAFYPQLQETVKALHGKSVEELVAEGRHKDVVAAIIMPDGMNYGQLPKALLTFHRSEDGVRTAIEEQLAEGAQTAASKGGKVRLHFTVSANHRALFEAKLAEAVPAMEKRYGVSYEVSLSEQKASTDTIAVTPDNELFRDSKGALVFRPGGHGALIENLNEIDASVVFIKNIDNVVADAHRQPTIKYKQVLGGILIMAQREVKDYLRELEHPTPELVEEVTEFIQGWFSYVDKRMDSTLPMEERVAALKDMLDRPLRVCGMVRNEGEPGGGPYNVFASDGNSVGPQILESTQIDLSKPENKELMASAGFFNPVDLVCFLKRRDGSRYNLPDYVDHATGFISEKSSEGRELRALELPGLWNGAMSKWNTIFVEVPAATFNPVKTVNDLLRPAHQ